MKYQKFIELIKDALEIKDETSLKTNLNDLPEYDSLALLSLIALIDESFGVSLSAEQFESVTTIESLTELIGKDKFND
jgi:acyl carrier protein